ncbi:MAG TPA: flagellar motor switch protein FliN [Tepidisphaeraceae bacterium]|nr:flagellar motor switch protein FliN [Tepidisphaeraceae bacterium]
MAEDQPSVPDSSPAETSSKAPEAAAAPAATPAPASAAAPSAAANPAPAGVAAASAETEYELPSDSSANLPGIDQAAIDEILKQASFEDPPQAAAAAAAQEAAAASPPLDELKLPDFQKAIQEAQVSSVDMLRDVDLNVKIELGRSRMLVEDVLKLGEGSVVELDKLAGDPVDVFVNERLVARGEVLVLNDNFCVRINEIVAGAKDEGL